MDYGIGVHINRLSIYFLRTEDVRIIWVCKVLKKSIVCSMSERLDGPLKNPARNDVDVFRWNKLSLNHFFNIIKNTFHPKPCCANNYLEIRTFRDNSSSLHHYKKSNLAVLIKCSWKRSIWAGTPSCQSYYMQFSATNQFFIASK